MRDARGTGYVSGVSFQAPELLENHCTARSGASPDAWKGREGEAQPPAPGNRIQLGMKLWGRSSG